MSIYEDLTYYTTTAVDNALDGAEEARELKQGQVAQHLENAAAQLQKALNIVEELNRYDIQTIKQVRENFWENHPKLKQEHYEEGKRQNEYIADVRMNFVDHVEQLRANRKISDQLASTVTL